MWPKGKFSNSCDSIERTGLMDLTYPHEVESFRDEICAFLQSSLPSGWAGLGALAEVDREQFLNQWRKNLVEHGLIAPHWPQQYGGRGLSVLEQSVLTEEFVKAGVPQQPHPNDGFGMNLLGPTLLHWGTDRQKEEFLAPTVRGDIRWAQGYSEPGAGSDLFALSTKAVRTEQGWRVTGQKVWQTAGITANWLFALVRTDPAQVRGKGISLMLIPVDQPGVEIRGIRNMAGQVEFSEVFFDGAHVDHTHVVGGENNGAKVALTLLGFERGAGGMAAAARNSIELNRIVELSRKLGRFDEPAVQERVGRCLTAVYTQRAIALKVVAAAAAGESLGAMSSIVKLVASTYRQQATELAIDILGQQLNDLGGDNPIELLQPQPLGFDPLSTETWLSDFMNARAISIYGGSSEVQRNTIGEQMLGLPREPRR